LPFASGKLLALAIPAEAVVPYLRQESDSDSLSKANFGRNVHVSRGKP